MPTLTALFSLIFLLSLPIKFEVVFEAKLLANPGKTFLANRTSRSALAFLPNALPTLHKLHKIAQRNPFDLIILDI